MKFLPLLFFASFAASSCVGKFYYSDFSPNTIAALEDKAQAMESALIMGIIRIQLINGEKRYLLHLIPIDKNDNLFYYFTNTNRYLLLNEHKIHLIIYDELYLDSKYIKTDSGRPFLKVVSVLLDSEPIELIKFDPSQ